MAEKQLIYEYVMAEVTPQGPIYVTSDGWTGCRLCGWSVRCTMTLPNEGHKIEHAMLAQHPDNGCEFLKLELDAPETRHG